MADEQAKEKENETPESETEKPSAVKKARGFFGEFRTFINQGNVIDMAVGVIIGGAFGKIVTSIVNDLIMPVFGFLTAGMDFKELKLVLSPAVVENGVTVKAEAAVLYGNFLQNVLDFLIISVSMFLVIRLFTNAKTRLLHKPEEEPAAEEKTAPPTTEELLTEIRDLLAETKHEE